MLLAVWRLWQTSIGGHWPLTHMGAAQSWWRTCFGVVVVVGSSCFIVNGVNDDDDWQIDFVTWIKASCPGARAPLHGWKPPQHSVRAVCIESPEKKKVGRMWAELPVEVTAEFRQSAIKQTAPCDHIYNNKSSCFCLFNMFQVYVLMSNTSTTRLSEV